jgi:O-antigen/teichoic acid export membrane protein
VKPADSPLKRLFVQVSHYSVASLLTTLAGLVSFPLLTRVFSVDDYGRMNLITATLSVAVALGKTGIQHSIVRYRSEIRAGKGRFTERQLYATTLIGMNGTGVIAGLILFAGSQIIPLRWMGDPRLRGLLAITSLILVVQVAESVFLNFLRADQETSLLMKYQVAKKYLSLGIILFTVFAITKSLQAFYSATLVTEATALVVVAAISLRRAGGVRISAGDFSRPLYVELLGFGLPMMIGYEMSGIILAVGDRYVIHGTIGETQLGLYSAAYNMCQYVQAVFVNSVGQAVMPLYMQMWDQKGVDETAAFVTRSLRTYVLFGAPVIAGLAAVGPQLLPALASSKYAAGSLIIPWVIAGMVVDGSNSMVAAGLFIHRKTKRIMAVVLTSATLNIALNFILVPRVGILGAAIATLACYTFAACALAWSGHRFLPVKLPWGTIVRAGLAALGMYALIIQIDAHVHLLTVALRALIGAPVYVALVALIDPDARNALAEGRQRMRRKFTSPEAP